MAPLAGTRIIDLSPNVIGRSATQLLADLGASVLAVSRPSPSADGAVATVGRNKTAIELDLKSPADRDVLLELLGHADVFVEGFRPGAVLRLGLGHETLRAADPRLIYCSVSGYGQAGPYAGLAGHDVNYQGVAGAIAFTEQDEPILTYAPWADRCAAQNLALAVVLALYRRETTGAGAYCDVAAADSIVTLPSVESYRHHPFGRVYNGGGPGSEGPPSPMIDIQRGVYPWYGVYCCGDGRYLSLGCVEERFYRALCEVVGRPEWSDDQYAPEPRRAEIAEGLRQIIAGRPRQEWLDAMWAADVAAAPVNRGYEVTDDVHLRARGMVVSANLPTGSSMWQVGLPIMGDGLDLVVERAVTPAAGDRAEQVAEWLGRQP